MKYKSYLRDTTSPRKLEKMIAGLVPGFSSCLTGHAGVCLASAVVPGGSEDGGGRAGGSIPGPGGRTGQPHPRPVHRPRHHPAGLRSAVALLAAHWLGEKLVPPITRRSQESDAEMDIG
jgi:hypothetical protein